MDYVQPRILVHTKQIVTAFNNPATLITPINNKYHDTRIHVLYNMIQELWSNRTNISQHFSQKLGIEKWWIGKELGWLLLVALGLLLVYTLIRYYEWSRRHPSTTIVTMEGFTPQDWPDHSETEKAGLGPKIINYIQPGDHQCANLQAYISSEYLIYMNQPNIQARGFDTLSELADRYRNGVCQMITEEEQLMTTTWIMSELEALQNPIWQRIAEKWLQNSYLCKAQTWLEGGMPHTHGRAILMRPDWFSVRIMDNTVLGILWHEMTHIWQRFQPGDFTGLYREWGFTPLAETPNGLETILLRSRLNPDALPMPSSPLWIWRPSANSHNKYTPTSTSQVYWIGGVYLTLTPSSLHDIQFLAYPLAAGGTRYLGQQPIELAKFKEYSDFFGNGRNHYHPNELAAHYMDELLTGKANLDVPAVQIFSNWLEGFS